MMVPVDLAKVIIDEKNHEQGIVLRERGGFRQVPIVIGIAEASSIQMYILGVEPPRPMTHDLLAALIRSLGAEVERFVIEDVSEGTFYAILRVKNPQGEFVNVDCRPSDGIALAIRLGVPMFIEDTVFTKALANQ